MSATSPEQSKWSSMWARTLVRGATKKARFGKPYVTLGSLIGICGFLFQQSGLLGRAFQSKPAPFAVAFAGTEGHGQEAADHMCERETQVVLPHLKRVNTIHQLVVAMLIVRMKAEGSWAEWLVREGGRRISIDTAFNLAWQYSLVGAGFGMRYPDQFEALFDKTYRKGDGAEWQQAYEFGVVGTPEPPTMSIEQSQHETVQEFARYCKEFYPHLLQPLGLGG